MKQMSSLCVQNLGSITETEQQWSMTNQIALKGGGEARVVAMETPKRFQLDTPNSHGLEKGKLRWNMGNFA